MVYRRIPTTLTALVFVITMTALLLRSTTVLAATPTAQPNSPNGQGIEISPPVIDIKADPGQSIKANIRIRNVTSGDLTVRGQVDDFGAKGEDGEPDLLLGETAATRYSVKFWIPSVPSFTLKSQEVRTAEVQINVPANAEPGGHYGVVRFTGLPPNVDGTGVSLSASIGALILLRVSGNITEQLSITDFYASKHDARKGFFETGPITLNERIKNEGSIHVKPSGYVEVYNTFGKRVQHLAISDPPHNILPDSIRKFSQTTDKKFMFGRYTVKFKASYGDNKSISSRTISFWVIPYRLIAALLIALLTLLFLLRLGIKRYNRFIVEQARNKK
jgi:hypothetical protein